MDADSWVPSSSRSSTMNDYGARNDFAIRLVISFLVIAIAIELGTVEVIIIFKLFLLYLLL
jgi:hypothetical protein